jgi:hypothetical protein
MNENHSQGEFIYKRRWIGPSVRAAVATFPVVVITGARQVGKSTFVRKEFPDFKYINLDDFPAYQQAKSDPSSLWTGHDRIILDEAQRAPEIFGAIKSSVDQSQRKMRFLLSGSSNLLLMRSISETLAGRAVYFEMLPMSYGEMYGDGQGFQNMANLFDPAYEAKGLDGELIDPLPYLIKGFMPPLLNLTNKSDVLLWWEGYVKTYLERDLRELSQVESLIDFRKVLEAAALRTGNLLNQTEISRDTGVSQPTVSRYVKLLEVSNIVSRVPAYYSSRVKRTVKSPKIFFVDPGLSIYLAKYHDEDSLGKGRELGSFFETLVYLHLKIFSELLVPKASLFYWRTTTGKEVDFILEHGRKLLAFEVKLTPNPTLGDIKNLLTFIEENPHTLRGVLIHAGKSIRWLHSKVLAVPWTWLAQ